MKLNVFIVIDMCLKSDHLGTYDVEDYYENDEHTKLLGPFNKTTDFKWQNEFRFAFYEEPVSLEPTILKIGDISDLAIKVDVEYFLDNTIDFFEEYIQIF